MPDGWLFLPADRKWKLDTKGLVIDTDSLPKSEMYAEDIPLIAKENQLISALEGGAIGDIRDVASRIQDPPSDDLLLEAFLYYYRFDAFLPHAGAPDPPPAHVATHNIDRRFYESLGPEDAAKRCKHAGCGRGSVSLSVFCRVHHFENVMGKGCPFDD